MYPQRFSYVSIIVLGLVVLFTGCRSTNPQVEREGEATTVAPSILFVDFKITRDSLGKEHVEALNVSKRDGQLKTERTSTAQGQEILRCRFVDANEQLIKELVVDHPLIVHAERYSETGQISRVTLDVNSAYFTLRTQLSERMEYLLIQNGKHEQLIKLKIR